MITNNAAPILSADLAYEAHGKCGNTRILTSMAGSNIFDASAEGNGNAYKMVILQVGTESISEACRCTFFGIFRKLRCNNMSLADITLLEGMPITNTFELYGDFTLVELDASIGGFTVVLYMDCQQS